MFQKFCMSKRKNPDPYETVCSGGSRGGAAGTRPPPQGSRFFCFDIQNFRNIAASGVGTPLRGWRPPMGNPGSATGMGIKVRSYLVEALYPYIT